MEATDLGFLNSIKNLPLSLGNEFRDAWLSRVPRGYPTISGLPDMCLNRHSMCQTSTGQSPRFPEKAVSETSGRPPLSTASCLSFPQLAGCSLWGPHLTARTGLAGRHARALTVSRRLRRRHCLQPRTRQRPRPTRAQFCLPADGVLLSWAMTFPHLRWRKQQHR